MCLCFMLLILHFLISVLELFATEHAHVRMLSVLQWVFAKPLERAEILSALDLETIFPSLEEIIDMHCECCCNHIGFTNFDFNKYLVSQKKFAVFLF